MPDDFIGCGMNTSLEDLLGTKKKKKTDKGQAQLNKCLNEKRRREQENLYIEEIAELISASMTDMSNFSVKPDKCAILQETVNQIRRIKQEVSGQSDAVQQSQVSSSKPTILASDVLGPILLEALDGFLFVVNSQGKVEFVSDNVTQFLKYPQDDLVGKSIYNIIHVGDHAQFSNSLLPMSLGNCLSWGPADNPVGKSRTFNCRMLIKNPGEEEDELEAKQTAVSQYENMQISAVLQPYPSDKDADTPPSKEQGETQYCLVCIARRLGFAEKTGGMLGVEQFTIKQDLQGKILAFDTSRITPSQFSYPDFVGQNIQDFCHINDVQQLTKHHQEVLKCGSSTSGVFRFKLAENRYVFVQTRSKLFTANNKPEFVMSTHSIVRECDSDTELKGSASTSLMKSIIGQTSGGTKRDAEDIKSPTGLVHPLLGGAGAGQTNTGLLLGGGSMTNLGSGGMGSLGNLANLPSDVDITNDTVNIDDVIGLLTGNNWDNPLATTPSASLPGGAGPLNPQGGVSSSNTHTPVTHVSWSNMSSVNIAHGTGRSLPLTMPSRNMMGMKSPVSPGFANQRSPGFAAQRSPGFAPQMSPIPSPGAGQKSPAATGMGGFQCPAVPGVPRASPSIRNSITSTSQTSCTFDDEDLNSILESLQQSASVPSKNTQQLMRPPAGKGRAGGQNQNNWSNNQQSPLQALKSLEMQAGTGSQASKLSQASAMKASKDNSYLQEYYLSMDKKLDKRSQIRNLIAHENDASVSKKGKALPDGSQPLQSPTPGPGQSPKNTSPQQPQSTTSNEESHPDSSRDSISSKSGKAQSNVILKQLLSQEDSSSEDDQDVFPGESASSSNGPTIKAKSAATDSSDDMERNEAEPKKLDNALLKQLLNDDSAKKSLEESKQKGNSSHLLQKLLLENEDTDTEENKTLAKAESTSQESVDKSLDDPFASLLDSTPGPSSGIDDALLKNVLSLTSNPGNTPGGGNKNNQKATNLEVYLSNLWEKQTELDNKPNLKRKMSDTDLVDSTDMDMEPTVHTGSGQSKLSKRNVLLAQLLSKKTTKENVVNTQLTVNPASTPQLRLPKNLADKIIDSKDGEGKGIEKTPLGASDSNVIKSEGKRPSQWDNPRTNPNSPFPGNTKDNAGNQPTLQGGGPSTAGITSMDTSSVPMSNLNVNTGPNNIVSSSTSESAMATSSADANGQDPLLSQILQQVTELQNDFSASNQGAQGASVNLDQSMTDDTNLLRQLELVLNSSNISLQEIDSMLGINSQQSQQYNNMSEQMAINVIEQQLLQGMDSATQPQQQGMQQKLLNKQQMENAPPSSQSLQSNAITPQSQMAAILSQQGQDPAQQQQALEAMLMRQQQQQQQQQHQQQQQQQQTQQHVNMVNPLNQQGVPRFPNAQGIQNFIQQPGSSVRQSLIMQQRQKAMRQQKQQQQHQQQQRQERQRLLQQQERQQCNFPQTSFQQQGQTGHGGVPENFSELMNTTMAPNVSLQRSQSMGATPGSISPRGFPVVGNPALPQQAMSPMIHGNNPQNRLSPFASGAPGGNPGAGGRQGQWNQRANQAMMAGGSVVQSPQFGNMNRVPNSMGPNVPQSPQGSEQFAQFGQGDGQFGPGQGTQHGGGHGHGQNQQMGQAPAMMSPNHPQSRMIGRQMSMPGAGPSGMSSPRGGGQQSPFGGQDPLLMSPHSQNLSPNQQVSPQGQMNVPMSQPGMNQIATSMGLSQQMNMGGQQSFPPMGQQGPGISPQAGSQMGQSPNLQQNFTQEQMFQIAQERNKMAQNNGQGGNTSQYVKQELRGLINTRTQNQQAISLGSDPVSSLDSELPMEIFESLNEMRQQQQQQQQQSQQLQPQTSQQQFMATSMAGRTASTSMDLPNDDMALSSARKEASVRYEKFRQLSYGGTQERLGHGNMEPTGPNGKAWPQWKQAEDPEVKASNVFRNQLVGSAKQEPPPATKKKPLDPSNVHVVQNEPRTPIDDIKPADQKNSLLQQLLSSE